MSQNKQTGTFSQVVTSPATCSEEISTHEPCKYDPSRAVQCVYCKPAAPLQVGKWYAEHEDDGQFGSLYKCTEIVEQDGTRYYVMDDESDSEPRWISGPSATTEFWTAQR